MLIDIVYLRDLKCSKVPRVCGVSLSISLYFLLFFCFCPPPQYLMGLFLRNVQHDLLQEHRAAASLQQNSNLSLLTSSGTREGRSGSSYRGPRGYRGEESRLSTLAMLLRGQAHERRLQGAAMEARDRLDERLRSAALPPRFSANPPRFVIPHGSL